MMIIPLSLIFATLVVSPSVTWTSHPSSKLWPKITYRLASNMGHAQKNMQPVGALLPISALKKHRAPLLHSGHSTDTKIATSTSPFSPSEKSHPSLSANHQLQTCQKYDFVWASGGIQQSNSTNLGGRYMWVVLQKLQIAKQTGTNMRGGEIGG